MLQKENPAMEIRHSIETKAACDNRAGLISAAIAALVVACAAREEPEIDKKPDQDVFSSLYPPKKECSPAVLNDFGGEHNNECVIFNPTLPIAKEPTEEDLSRAIIRKTVTPSAKDGRFCIDIQAVLSGWPATISMFVPQEFEPEFPTGTIGDSLRCASKMNEQRAVVERGVHDFREDQYRIRMRPYFPQTRFNNVRFKPRKGYFWPSLAEIRVGTFHIIAQ